MKKIIILIIFLNSILASAQETFIVNGTHNKNHNTFAFTNATIHTDYQTTIENGTLVIKDGKILAVGKNVPLPKNVILQNLNGKHLYPSLIDLYSDYGIAKKVQPTKQHHGPQIETSSKGAFNWNQAIRPEVEAG
jgi:imidazolonepropionase-like amidohydrolase